MCGLEHQAFCFGWSIQNFSKCFGSNWDSGFYCSHLLLTRTSKYCRALRFIMSVKFIVSRIVNFQENEKKQVNEWRKQSEIFLDWMDKMDEQFAETEEMKSEDDLNELVRQAQALKVSFDQHWD